MRTTVTIDDELYQQALDMADPGMDKAELFREAIKTFVRTRAAKRLASLGGAASEIQDIPRRHEDAPTALRQCPEAAIVTDGPPASFPASGLRPCSHAPHPANQAGCGASVGRKTIPERPPGATVPRLLHAMAGENWPDGSG